MMLDMVRDAVGSTINHFCRLREVVLVALSSPIMVVTHVAPPSAHKKNRRSLAKRKAIINGNSEASSTKPSDMDEDEDMQLEPLSTQSNKDAQEDDELEIDVDPESAPQAHSVPSFPALPAAAQSTALKSETRRVPIPPHRMTPIKRDWVNIFSPLTEILGLQVRMNVQRRCVEIRVCICQSSISTPNTAHIDVKTHKRHWVDSKRSRFRQSLCIGF